MKLSVASVIAFAGSAAAFQAPTMAFSFGKKKAAAPKAPPAVSGKWRPSIKFFENVDCVD